MTDLQVLEIAFGIPILYALIFGLVLWFRIAGLYRENETLKWQYAANGDRMIDAKTRTLDLTVRLDAVDAWIEGQAAIKPVRATNGRFTKQKRS